MYNTRQATIKIDYLLHLCGIKEFLNEMEWGGGEGTQFYMKISEKIYRENKITQYKRLERYFKKQVFDTGYNNKNYAIKENYSKDIR